MKSRLNFKSINFDPMSVEQRKTAWDVTKMIVSVLLAISSFFMVEAYRRQVREMEAMNNRLDVMSSSIRQVEIKMVRVEYELKLK